MKHGLAAALLLAASLHTGAQAQSIWRCGPEGRSYSDQPCPAGHALELADTRSPVDVQAAREVAEGERRLANQLTQQRLQREREAGARGPGLAGIGAAAPVGQIKPKAKPRTRPKPKTLPPAATGTSTRVARVSRRAPG